MRFSIGLLVVASLVSCTTLKDGPSAPENALAIGHFTMMDKAYKVTAISLFRVDGAYGDYASSIVYPDGSFCFLDLKPGKYEVTRINVQRSLFGLPTEEIAILLRDLFTAHWVFEVKPHDIINVGSYALRIEKSFILAGYSARIDAIDNYDMRETFETLIRESGNSEWAKRLNELQNSGKSSTIETKEFPKSTT